MKDLPKIYHYHSVSGELIGESFAEPDQLNPGTFLMPAFATETAPPVAGAGQTCRWVAGDWELVTDLRGHRYWLDDGSEHVITELGVPMPVGALDEAPPPPLAEVRAAALRRVDHDAEHARMQFITPGEGQAWTYQRKEREAEAFLTDPSPDPANYPVLSACIPGDGANLAAVSATVLAARDAWLAVGAVIEGRRRAAKVQIEGAADEAAIQTILDGLNWPEAPA